MAAKQRHTHIVAEDANGQPFERVEDSPIKAQTAHMVIARCGGRIMRNVYCTKPIAECRKPENRVGGEAYMHLCLQETVKCPKCQATTLHTIPAYVARIEGYTLCCQHCAVIVNPDRPAGWISG